MPALFDFQQFRDKVNSDAREGLCKWSEKHCTWSKQSSDCNCCTNMALDDDLGSTIKWLLKNPRATALNQMPSDLFEGAFCTKHLVMANDACNDARRPSTPTPYVTLENASQLSCQRLSHPERDSQSGHSFASTNRNIPLFDSIEARKEHRDRNVESALSNKRLPRIFSGVKDGEKRVEKVFMEKSASESGAHVNINGIAMPRTLPKTPDRPAEREERYLSPDPFQPERGRSPISEEDEAKRANSHYEKHKSRSRSRTSPTPSPNRRVELAYATMEGDNSYDKLPLFNEEAVVDLLIQPLTYTDKKNETKKAIVYALHDPQLDLVKIGWTIGTAEERLKSLVYNCKLPSMVHVVYDGAKRPLLAYRHLEKLVHADLSPHRWYFNCECGLKSNDRFREHHEWFDVSEEVAIDTINLWADFLSTNPYGELRNGLTITHMKITLNGYKDGGSCSD